MGLGFLGVTLACQPISRVQFFNKPTHLLAERITLNRARSPSVLASGFGLPSSPQSCNKSTNNKSIVKKHVARINNKDTFNYSSAILEFSSGVIR